MAIYVETEDFLGHIFQACTTDQIQEFIAEKRAIRIHGHSTTIRLERAFWSVVEAMAKEMSLSVPQLIERVHDTCLMANDKNLSSCLRVICLKYINVYAADGVPDSADRRAPGQQPTAFVAKAAADCLMPEPSD